MPMPQALENGIKQAGLTIVPTGSCIGSGTTVAKHGRGRETTTPRGTVNLSLLCLLLWGPGIPMLGLPGPSGFEHLFVVVPFPLESPWKR